MTEAHTDHNERYNGPRAEGVPEGLQLDVLDQIVDYQHVIGEFYRRSDQSVDYETFKDQEIDRLLNDNGIFDDTDDQQTHDDFTFAKGVYRRVAFMDHSDWLTTPEGDDTQRKNIVDRQVLEYYRTRAEHAAQQPGQAEDDEPDAQAGRTEADDEPDELDGRAETDNEQDASDESDLDPAIRSGRARLEELRDDLAKITAKKQGKAFSLNNKKYETARARYNKQLQKLGKLELAELLSDSDLSETEKHTAVIAYIFEEQANLRQETAELLKGTKVSKFVSWMNEGKVTTRIAKGLAVGVGAGLVGAFVAGAGASLVAAGSAAYFGRFARGFARSDAKRGRGMTGQLGDESYKRAFRQKLETEDQINFDDAVSHADKKFVADTKVEQKKRRKSIAAGVGGLAIGGVLAAAFHAASELPQVLHTDDQTGSISGGGNGPSVTDGASGPDGPGTDNGPGTGPGNGPEQLDRGGMFDGYQGSREFTAAGQKDFNNWISKNGGYEVKPGDSVWSLSEQYLHANGVSNPTVYEVDAVKDSVLQELQANGLADSNGWLSVGDTIKIE